MAFRLSGIDPAFAAPLFALDDAALRARGMRRVVADRAGAFPCRASLEDAAVGEDLLLLPFEHLPGDSPYRASGPVFLRRGVARAVLPPGVVPPYVTNRLISLRAYGHDDMMVEGLVVEGGAVADALARQFDDPAVARVHLHNARRGCFSCEATRA